jgi:hypothetical protein
LSALHFCVASFSRSFTCAVADAAAPIRSSSSRRGLAFSRRLLPQLQTASAIYSAQLNPRGFYFPRLRAAALA